MICWDPKAVSTTANPTFSDALQTLQNVTVSIAGNESVAVKIPWRQPMPWTFVPDPRFSTSPSLGGTTNGRIFVFVVNPLTSNGSTDSIACNVYVHSDNIAFASPDAKRIATFDVVDELLSAPFCPVTDAEFGQGTKVDKPFLRAFGEEYVSLKQLSSKLSISSTGLITQAAADTNTYMYHFEPNMPMPLFLSGPVSTAQRMNYLSWVCTAFMGYRGSMRHVFHYRNTANNVSTVMNHMWTSSELVATPAAPSSGFTTTLEGVINAYAFTVQNRGISPNAEVVAPMLYPFDFVPTRQKITTFRNLIAGVVAVTRPTVDTSITMDVLSASGDDASFAFFLGFPLIR